MSPTVGSSPPEVSLQQLGRALLMASGKSTTIGRLRSSEVDGNPSADAKASPSSPADATKDARNSSAPASESASAAIQYSQDRDLNRWVLKLVDPATQEVLRQIPPEAILDVMRQLRSVGKSASGNLFDQYS